MASAPNQPYQWRELDPEYVGRLRPDLRDQVNLFCRCGFRLHELVIDRDYEDRESRQGAVVPKMCVTKI